MHRIGGMQGRLLSGNHLSNMSAGCKECIRDQRSVREEPSVLLATTKGVPKEIECDIEI